MTTLLSLLQSPLGPALLLALGAIVQLLIGRWVRRAEWLTAIALLFLAGAGWLVLQLREQAVVPTYSHPWQPLLQTGANLYWVGDGWNWYISGLILLLGGLGVLLELNPEQGESGRRNQRVLAGHLAVLAMALLFVNSGNLLTAVLTWVALDLLMLVRSALRMESGSRVGESDAEYAQGLSLVGAMLLLVGLVLAGPGGPGLELQTGRVPLETAIVMMIAAAIRAGIYPFHLWLLPEQRSPLAVADRLLEQLVPALCGLWLLGWTFGMGSEFLSGRVEVITLLVLALLGSAIAAWTSSTRADHGTLVLVTSAGLAALGGALADQHGPAAMIWPTTAFALGGGLWLVGDQVWRGWGWQLPVSVGALALAGVPFTPGFLTQPAPARLLNGSGFSLLLFAVYVIAQTLQIAAMLRSWEDVSREAMPLLPAGAVIRLLIASLAIGLPLAVAGLLPPQVLALASMPTAIPAVLGRPANVVAPLPVHITWALPLILGLALLALRPKGWSLVEDWSVRINRIVRLDWLFRVGWWTAIRVGDIWGNALRVVEGAGFIGWLIVFVLLGYLLIG